VTEEAEAYLTSLPGVGVKTAKCVLMCALDRPVLPVDTRVGRLTRRLELAPGGLRDGKLHTALEAVVPLALR
jgi:endonuclease III